jgi:hypothetical protein
VLKGPVLLSLLESWLRKKEWYMLVNSRRVSVVLSPASDTCQNQSVSFRLECLGPVDSSSRFRVLFKVCRFEFKV